MFNLIKRAALFEAAATDLKGRGAVIRESLKSTGVLKLFHVLGETHMPWLKEHAVQVAFDSAQLDALAKKLKPSLKPSWFAYLWNDDKVVIVFSDRIIEHRNR